MKLLSDSNTHDMFSFSLIYIYTHTDIATVLAESCSSVSCHLVLVDEPTFVTHMRNLRLVLGLCSYTHFRSEVMSPSPNRDLALTQHMSCMYTRGTFKAHSFQLSWACLHGQQK